MLVLTRKEQERIIIGDGVEVVVLAVNGQRIKLGIHAAPHIRIERPERSSPTAARQLVVGCGIR